MKGLAIFISIFCSITLAYCSGFGFDLWYQLDSETEENRDPFMSDYIETTTEHSLHFQPKLVSMRNDKLEISPFIIFQFTAYKSKIEADFGSMTHKSDQFGIGAGLGIHYHFIRKEMVNVNLGSRISYGIGFQPGDIQDDSFLDMDIVVSAPLNIDLHLNDRCNLRMGWRIGELSYSVYKRENTSVKESAKKFDFDINSVLIPSFGIYFMY